MYFIVKAALRTLLLPPASCLLLMLIGWVVIGRFRRVGLAFVLTGVFSLTLMSTGVVSIWLWKVAEAYPALDVSQPTDAQAIVIVGGGGVREMAPEYRGPAPEPLLLDRIGYGAYVARATGLPILVSGAPEEAVVMQAALERNFGIKATWAEGDSRDTYQNARLTSHMLRPLGINRIILITMSAHMRRATAEFRDAGFTVTPAPSGVTSPHRLTVLAFIPQATSLERSSAAIYELLGEPARRIQAALGVREIFDKKAAGR